jgi:hypothetical protein
LDQPLAAQGFTVERSVDVTANMMPMVHAFSLIGRFPYWVGRVSGLVYKVVNGMRAREIYKHRDAWRYGIHTAVKCESKAWRQIRRRRRNYDEVEIAGPFRASYPLGQRRPSATETW